MMQGQSILLMMSFQTIGTYFFYGQKSTTIACDADRKVYPSAEFRWVQVAISELFYCITFICLDLVNFFCLFS